MAGATTQIDQPPFGQQDDALAILEDDVVNLRLDFFPLAVFFQFGDLDFVVKMADVANDGLILHPLHVFVADHVAIAGGGHENVGLIGGILHRHHAVAFHGGLQCTNRINLGDPHLGRERPQRLRTALAHVAIAAHHGDLAGHHHVGGAFDTVHQ